MRVKLMGTLREQLLDHLRGHLAIYALTLALFAMGVVMGSLAVRALTDDQRGELFEYVEVFLRGLGQGEEEVNPHQILQVAAANHLKTAVFLWALGVTIIGIPLIALIIISRGFVVGFTVGFLIYQMGYKGVIFTLFSVLPQNILAVPAVIGIGALSLSYSLHLIRSQRRRRRAWDYREFAGYTLMVVTLTAMLLGASLVEAYISRVFMQVLTPRLL